MSDSAPVVTVVVTAYHRRNFVSAALDSALRQTYPRSKYEVILIKNFIDSELDTRCEKDQIQVVNAEGALGEYLSIGISQARGRVICFLEDDDLFAPEKLSTVAHLYDQYAFDYLHNNYTCINSAGTDIALSGSKLLHLTSETRQVQVARSPRITPSVIGRLLRAEADFNLSCISISRTFGLSIREWVAKTRGCFDGFVFYMSLRGGGPTVAWPGVLTKYRVHESLSLADVSSGAARERIIADGLQQAATLRLAATLMPGGAVQESVLNTMRVRDIRNAVFSAEPGRLTLVPCCIRVLFHSSLHRNFYGIAWGSIGMLYVVVGGGVSLTVAAFLRHGMG